MAEGKTKSIGVSNFNPEQLDHLISVCKIKPVCNQFEVNPYFHNDEWVDFCQKENIAVVGYAPIGALDRPWLFFTLKLLLIFFKTGFIFIKITKTEQNSALKNC